MPTILEAAGIGRQKRRWHQAGADRGRELRLHLDAKNAKAPSRHKTQYFEMMGTWALYHEGWMLSTKVIRAPWAAFGAANPDPLNNQVCELYNLSTDYTQTDRPRGQEPDRR